MNIHPHVCIHLACYFLVLGVSGIDFLGWVKLCSVLLEIFVPERDVLDKTFLFQLSLLTRSCLKLSSACPI